MRSIEVLMKTANPFPLPRADFGDDEVDALLTLTRARSTPMGTTEVLRPTEPEKKNRRGGIAAAAAFAAIVVIVGGSLLLSDLGGGDADPATDVTTTTPTTTTPAEEVEALNTMMSFLDAKETHDVDAALALVADDAVVSLGPAESKADLALEMQWQQATGLVAALRECSVMEATGPSDGSVAIRCTADATSPIAAIGEADPMVFTYEATVNDGSIATIESVDLGTFSAEVWEPFQNWVKVSRPDAYAIMYSGGGTGIVLSKESIDLWQQNTEEYVNEKTFSEAFANSVAYLAARHDGEVQRAVSYLAPEAFLDWGPGTSPDELAAGLAWESALGISFEPRTCVVLSGGSSGDNGEVVNLRCSILATSAISEAVGDPGSIECVSILVEGGVIQSMQMGDYRGPGCDGFSFAARVFDPFTSWLAEAHPEESFDDLYAHRSTDGDIERWRVLTEEFVAAQEG